MKFLLFALLFVAAFVAVVKADNDFEDVAPVQDRGLDVKSNKKLGQKYILKFCYNQS